mmetsp:Transcript_14763/g.42003  ORF Transcript_14763/g.42003 Transcript_14763/m.42003 type:complete len:268 (+) Transcript_14763:509-1312(+)
MDRGVQALPWERPGWRRPARRRQLHHHRQGGRAVRQQPLRLPGPFLAAAGDFAGAFLQPRDHAAPVQVPGVQGGPAHVPRGRVLQRPRVARPFVLCRGLGDVRAATVRPALQLGGPSEGHHERRPWRGGSERGGIPVPRHDSWGDAGVQPCVRPDGRLHQRDLPVPRRRRGQPGAVLRQRRHLLVCERLFPGRQAGGGAQPRAGNRQLEEQHEPGGPPRIPYGPLQILPLPQPRGHQLRGGAAIPGARVGALADLADGGRDPEVFRA